MNSPEFQNYIQVLEDEPETVLRDVEIGRLLHDVPPNLMQIEGIIGSKLGPPGPLTLRDEDEQIGWSLKFEGYGRVVDRVCFYPPKYQNISPYKLVHQCFTSFEHVKNNSGFMISTDIYYLQHSADEPRISLLFQNIVDSYDREALLLDQFPREDMRSALSNADNQVVANCEDEAQEITNFRLKRFFQFLQYINDTVQNLE